jgi:N-ethylmaleimide reductase
MFSAYQLGELQLSNRIVMAPMTRCRAIDNIPNALIARYYEQRATAGLIITEGTAPSPNGLGYARIPGIYSDAQINGWRAVTERVHAADGRIFLQIMHTGRVSHPLNMPPQARIVAPSALALAGEMYTDQQGMQPYPVPEEMTADDIHQAQGEFVQAALNALAAGFDGIEIHAANGYLVNQFVNPASNKRRDEYGGSIANRCRFAIETAAAVAEAIGPEKTGIRISPYGVGSGMEIYDNIDATYLYLATLLGQQKLAYMHIVDHSAFGAPEVPEAIKRDIRDAFGGPIILCGNLNRQRAEELVAKELADLVAFGRPFIANPDLVKRMQNDEAVVEADASTFYTAGEEGLVDY